MEERKKEKKGCGGVEVELLFPLKIHTLPSFSSYQIRISLPLFPLPPPLADSDLRFRPPIHLRLLRFAIGSAWPSRHEPFLLRHAAQVTNRILLRIFHSSRFGSDIYCSSSVAHHNIFNFLRIFSFDWNLLLVLLLPSRFRFL